MEHIPCTLDNSNVDNRILKNDCTHSADHVKHLRTFILYTTETLSTTTLLKSLVLEFAFISDSILGVGEGGGGWISFRIFGFRRKNRFGFWIWRIFYTDLLILLIQQTADLSNILAQIVDFACNLVRILDCDFIIELLADPNLDKTIVGSADFASNFGGSVGLYTLFTPPPPTHTHLEL
jgi:hypothetical protein